MNNIKDITIRTVYVRSLMLFTVFLFVPFLTYAQKNVEWPDIPLLSIETVDGVEPTFTKVYPPEGAIGESIISEHVPGRLVITLKGESLYDSGDYVKGESGIRIKIRGNTSGANLQQKPYKLKLSKKVDLLNFGKSAKSKDWALLSLNVWNTAMNSADCGILPLVGLSVCRALDFPWTPNTKFVNVLINGNYKGLYHLIETVERADNRIATDKSGFVIENDAYWWKPNEVFFKTGKQHQCMGFTFKYPDSDDITDEQLSSVSSYMNTVEEAIFKNDGSAADYIDYESFARWILVHDILGSSDAAGSNMFLYKEVFDENNPVSSKLKMATLWDFDTSFKRSATEWSAQHIHSVFYYPQLFKDKAFVQKYLELYNAYKDKVYSYVESYFNDLKADYGEATRQSMQLHRMVYTNECKNTFDEQMDEVLEHLKSRMQSLQTLTATLESSTAVHEVSTQKVQLLIRTDLLGNDFTTVPVDKLQKNYIYIEKYSDGRVNKVMY